MYNFEFTYLQQCSAALLGRAHNSPPWLPTPAILQASGAPGPDEAKGFPCTSSRENKSVLPQLGKSHRQFMGTGSSEGLQTRAGKVPLSTPPAHNGGSSGAGTPAERGDPHSAIKRSHCQSPSDSSRGRLLFDDVLSPEEGGQLQTSHQSAFSEQIFESKPFQDGRNAHCKRSTAGRGLDDSARPQG